MVKISSLIALCDKNYKNTQKYFTCIHVGLETCLVTALLPTYYPMCMCSRGKVLVIGLYFCRVVVVVVGTKSPVLEIYTSVHDVITTYPEISMKNCLLYSWNCRTWFTSSTNRAFSLQHACGLPTTPILLVG